MSTSFETRQLTVLEREESETTTVGVPKPISSSPPQNVGGPVVRRDGRVMNVRVVCCEQDSLFLRLLLYIYIQDELRETFFPRCSVERR